MAWLSGSNLARSARCRSRKWRWETRHILWPSLERTWLLLFHAFPRCGRANQLSPQTKLVELVECGKSHQISSNDIELAFHAGVTQECNGGSKMLMTHDIHEIMQDSWLFTKAGGCRSLQFLSLEPTHNMSGQPAQWNTRSLKQTGIFDYDQSRFGC